MHETLVTAKRANDTKLRARTVCAFIESRKDMLLIFPHCSCFFYAV